MALPGLLSLSLPGADSDRFIKSFGDALTKLLAECEGR